MATNPPKGMQRVIPYLLVKDVAVTMKMLCEAFGFEEVERVTGPDGAVQHGEVGYQDNVIMLGAARPPMEDFKSMVYCYVDDVDAHHAAAVAAGAKVTVELQDMFYGDRAYGCEDAEGNQFHFATHQKDMTCEEISAAAAAAFGGDCAEA